MIDDACNLLDCIFAFARMRGEAAVADEIARLAAAYGREGVEEISEALGAAHAAALRGALADLREGVRER